MLFYDKTEFEKLNEKFILKRHWSLMCQNIPLFGINEIDIK